jgi:hypothetical protein
MCALQFGLSMANDSSNPWHIQRVHVARATAGCRVAAAQPNLTCQPCAARHEEHTQCGRHMVRLDLKSGSCHEPDSKSKKVSSFECETVSSLVIL